MRGACVASSGDIEIPIGTLSLSGSAQWAMRSRCWFHPRLSPSVMTKLTYVVPAVGVSGLSSQVGVWGTAGNELCTVRLAESVLGTSCLPEAEISVTPTGSPGAWTIPVVLAVAAVVLYTASSTNG